LFSATSGREKLNKFSIGPLLNRLMLLVSKNSAQFDLLTHKIKSSEAVNI
jgi:hypothetical protein